MVETLRCRRYGKWKLVSFLSLLLLPLLQQKRFQRPLLLPRLLHGGVSGNPRKFRHSALWNFLGGWSAA
ncbi:hypothetical protein BJQ58_26915 [Klebsiella pneumoniae]|nr:hypothetical protein [Klebsiella pneumoniae]